MIAIPRPDQHFSPDFTPALPAGFDVINGNLYYNGIDLVELAEHPLTVGERIEMPVTPMYVRRLATLRENYQALQQWFDAARRVVQYPGQLLVAYASKANPSEPVVSTLLQAGAAYECSSSYDVEIIRHAYAQGWIDHDRTILSNGFKIPRYAKNLVALRAEGFHNLKPIIDDLDEIAPFADSGLQFEVGLRALTDMSEVNRFGLDLEDLLCAGEQIEASGNLTLTIFHAMQTVKASYGLKYQSAVARSLRVYAALKRRFPSLRSFNFGGGLPGRKSDMDFQDWMIQTLQTIQRVCAEEAIECPDLILETGRYMVEDHAFKLFRVLKRKNAEDGVPFYVIDGSIMTNFPDAWALGDEFTVLPINNWNGPFTPARLSGLTCDQDDIYPTRKMGDMPIMLPEDTEDLIVGFFHCGAYQETLGGRNGAKHCLLPEGSELVLENDLDGSYYCETYEGAQTHVDVLNNMGYSVR